MSLLDIAVKKYNSKYFDWGGPEEGPPPYDGTQDIDNDGKFDIDCSHLVYNVLKAAGYKIPYMQTGKLNSDEALKYFDVIELQDATPDDLILYKSHVGIFSHYDRDKNQGEYFGSQSKGPGIAKFDEKGTWGWKMNFKILRPKKELKVGTIVNSYTQHAIEKRDMKVTRWGAQENELRNGNNRLECNSLDLNIMSRSNQTLWVR